MDYKENLQDLLTQLSLESKSVKKSVNKARKDSLLISQSHRGLQFFAVSWQNGKRKRKLLKDRSERVYQLAHRAYLKEYFARLEANERNLRLFLTQFLPTTYESLLPNLPKHFELLDPLYVQRPELLDNQTDYPNPAEDEFAREATTTTGHWSPEEWACRPYLENTLHKEQKIHCTARGVMCRSKSEAAILEKYDALGIMYHYDEVVRIGGQKLSPDFIGVRRDGKLIYHEHLGLSDPEYRANYDWKASLYASAGIVPGINLIYTYDNELGGLNLRLVEELLRDRYEM